MWAKTKDLVLLASLAINVPFIMMWAAAHAGPAAGAVPEAWRTRLSSQRAAAHQASDAPVRPSTRFASSGRSDGTRSVYRDLGVTDEQWHEIEPRLAQFRAAMFRLGREMKQQRDELVDLVAATELDHAAISAKQEEIVELHRTTGSLITENMLADREVLTPEQQTRFFKKLRDYCGPTSSKSNRSSRPAQKIMN